MKFQLLHTAVFDRSPIENALISGGISTLVVEAGSDLNASAQATAFLLDAESRANFSARHLQNFIKAGGAVVALGAVDETDIGDDLPDGMLSAFVSYPHAPRRLLLAIRSALDDSKQRADVKRLQEQVRARTKELNEIADIGASLNQERDYNTLLSSILEQARKITGSDAASLYLVEETGGQPTTLRFKLAQTHSRPEIPLVEFTIPIDHSSIAGYVASTGMPLKIDDAYFIAPDVEYTINRAIDEKYGYRTKSMLTIPMTNRSGTVIGVLQLINRKTAWEIKLDTPEDFQNQIVPYSDRIVELVLSLAGQAAVSIENSQLYEDIERLFEGFVTAAVTAIEQRDPTTFGHSGRVASMTVALAEVTDGIRVGKYADLTFTREQLRELRYAGLLHDFGKVGVREQVLVKAKKLYPTDLSLVKQRYAFIFRSAERDFYQLRAEYLETHGHEGYKGFLETAQAGHDERLQRLDDFLRLVIESNEPSVLPEGNFDELLRYADEYYHELDGTRSAYLTEDEVRYLTIRKGSLDAAERTEIESHVNHTYQFLQRIPWTKELQDIPLIAWGHHEKINGSGYPRGVTAEDISPQTRMMTIADIFDALTASDRPYKRALPVERALAIIQYEVNDGMIDQDLFDIFTQTKTYEGTHESSETGGQIRVRTSGLRPKPV